ncbi:hypothetical protein ES703_104145 [subsurface metagenome]
MIKSEKGFSLLAVIIAIALLGIIGAAFLMGLATVSKALLITDVRGTAETLAIKQMEYIRNQDYSSDPWAYELPLPADWEGPLPSWWTDNPPSLLTGNYLRYYVEARGAENFEGREGIRKIIVNIYNHDTDDLIFTLECYKVDQ